MRQDIQPIQLQSVSIRSTVNRSLADFLEARDSSFNDVFYSFGSYKSLFEKLCLLRKTLYEHLARFYDLIS